MNSGLVDCEVLRELQNMEQESYKEATWWRCQLENVQQVPLWKTVIVLMKYDTYCTWS